MAQQLKLHQRRRRTLGFRKIAPLIRFVFSFFHLSFPSSRNVAIFSASINHQHVFRLSFSKTNRNWRSRRRLGSAVRSIRTINTNSASDPARTAPKGLMWAPFRPSFTRTASKTKSSTSPLALWLRIIAKSECLRAACHDLSSLIICHQFSADLFSTKIIMTLCTSFRMDRFCGSTPPMSHTTFTIITVSKWTTRRASWPQSSVNSTTCWWESVVCRD